MTVPHRFARRLLLLAIFGIAQTLIVGCADSQTDHPDIAGPDIAGLAKCPDESAMAIDWPAKIGIGAWNQGPPGWAADRVAVLGVAWYYVWGPQPLDSDGHEPKSEFVPMIWNDAQLQENPKALADVSASDAMALLGFNEPDLVDRI